MGKLRAKIKPLVPPGKAPSQARAPVTSLKLARKLTSKFHTLLNRVSELKSDTKIAPPARVAQLQLLEAEMRAMGGREAYQEASALATKHFRSSRIVFKTLVRLGMQPRKNEPPLKVSAAAGSVVRVCVLYDRLAASGIGTTICAVQRGTIVNDRHHRSWKSVP